jgi:hypothetical protein
MKGPQTTFTILAVVVIGLVFLSQTLLPIMSANAEIKRWEAAEAIIERRLWQQTEYEAQLAEKKRQAPRTEATRAAAWRVVTWCGAVGASLALVGGGFWCGRTLLRRASELPPTKKIDDGLVMAGGAFYDRYTGMQTPVGIPQQPSLVHAEAYAIARSTERDKWTRLGFLAIQALPVVAATLRDNGLEPPQEAVRVLEALPARRENVGS